MIPVMPLKGTRILVNADLIEEIESLPDTVIVLANGRRLFVLDSPTDIVERIRHLRASVLACADNIIERDPAEVVPLRGGTSGTAGEHQ